MILNLLAQIPFRETSRSYVFTENLLGQSDLSISLVLFGMGEWGKNPPPSPRPNYQFFTCTFYKRRT